MSMRGLMSLLVVGRKRRANTQGQARRSPSGARAQRSMVGEGLERRVHLSTTTMSFVASPPVATAGAPWSVRTADLNEDGFPDMVVANLSASSVQVFLNTGSNAFGAPATIPITSPRTGLPTSQVRSVAIADLDGDGHQDLVVANFGGQAINIFYGNGNGGFAAAPPLGWTLDGIALLDSPLAITTGDFNHDSRLDIAVTNYFSSTVAVVLASPQGGYLPPTLSRVGSNPLSIVTADFDGDGVADLATANFSDRAASVLYGKGDGTFLPQKKYGAGLRPEAIATGDLNRDGRADLAVTTGDTKVAVLLSNGADQTFRKATRLHVGSGALGVAIADVNHDGNPDLAVTNFYSGSVSVLPGNGDGTFAKRMNFRTPFKRPRSVAVADFNDDGLLDMAVVGSSTSQAAILWGNTAPTAIHLSRTAVPPTPARQEVADLTVEDPTPDDRFKFALVKGEGAQDNSSFSVQQSGGRWVLKAKKALTLAKGVYHIRLQVTDAGGLSLVEMFEITVTESPQT